MVKAVQAACLSPTAIFSHLQDWLKPPAAGVIIAGAVALTFTSTAAAAEDAQSYPQASVFDFHAILDRQRSVANLLASGNLEEADRILQQLAAKYPSLAVLQFDSALVKLHRGREQEAMNALSRAVQAGLPAVMLESRNELQSLRGLDAFRALLREAQNNPPLKPTGFRSQPSPVVDGVALVDASNTFLDSRNGMLRAEFTFPPRESPAPLTSNSDLPAWLELATQRVNTWIGAGSAAGNYGDLYDNRDGAHSTLAQGLFPELTRLQYSEAAGQLGLNRGFNSSLLFSDITIGNASQAITEGPFWRSLPRMAMTDPSQIKAASLQYVANHVYVYPAHNDYAKGRDLFPANVPYFLVSVGSSGSDQAALQAVAAILASFKPEVKAFLTTHGLVAPTIQWIFRRGQLGIKTDDDYLLGRAHPSAFDGRRINLLDMVERAHALDIASIPAVVQLELNGGSNERVGIEVMYPTANETLFVTQSAVACVFRGTAYTKRITVDASKTKDPNGRPLTFRWSILRGNAEHVAIKYLNDRKSVAEIAVDWEANKKDGNQVPGNRVEIGMFASNGVNWSAPAFVSVVFPNNEKRTYRDGKIGEIDYAAPPRGYMDPVIFPLRRWRDVYNYDEGGRLLGWKRVRGQSVSYFTADGDRVVETDSLNRPRRTEEVAYRLTRNREGSPEVVEVGTAMFSAYHYQDEGDLTGKRTPPVGSRVRNINP